MRTTVLEVRSGAERLVDVTDRVRDFARREAAGSGLLHLFLPHATCGLALVETGAGSEVDLLATVDRLLPRGARWSHRHGSAGHGADHVLPAFVSPSLVLPVVDGDVQLGRWQSIVIVDPNVDNPVRRLRLSFISG